ncbi:hypothetical protein DRQ20_01950 [bacterium]|nr:MAG: hypothetical protein DRQ20_01950 [bacterium]
MEGFFHLFFTDLSGRLRGFTYPERRLDEILENGTRFDGSSCGLSPVESSDLILRPDKEACYTLPSGIEGKERKVYFCDVVKKDGSPLPYDPRSVLKKVVTGKNYELLAEPELEFFYLPSRTGALYAGVSFDAEHKARMKAVEILEEMGIRVKVTHREGGPSQHEIELEADEPMRMSDKLQLAKLVVKETAKEFGLKATFLPRIFPDFNGSGMHVHLILRKEGRNLFENLEGEAGSFVEGLLRHAGEIAVLTNPSVNSYRRLVEGFEAPVYIAWGRMNRTALVRIPASGKSVEYRGGDGTANPYLLLASLFYAGFKGMEGNYPLRPESTENLYERAGVERLPSTLMEAIECAEKGSLLQELLGEEGKKRFLEEKKKEVRIFAKEVTEKEKEYYGDI